MTSPNPGRDLAAAERWARGNAMNAHRDPTARPLVPLMTNYDRMQRTERLLVEENRQLRNAIGAALESTQRSGGFVDKMGPPLAALRETMGTK